MWQLTRILQMNPPNSWKMYSQLKQQTQCKLIKFTVACASDALDGRIKAHLNLISNNWAFDLVDKFFTATFWSTFLRTNLKRGIMEKKMEIFKLYSEAFRGAYFWRMGEKFVQNSFSNFKALFMYADLKNPFDPVSPRPDYACHKRYFPPWWMSPQLSVTHLV